MTEFETVMDSLAQIHRALGEFLDRSTEAGTDLLPGTALDKMHEVDVAGLFKIQSTTYLLGIVSAAMAGRQSAIATFFLAVLADLTDSSRTLLAAQTASDKEVEKAVSILRKMIIFAPPHMAQQIDDFVEEVTSEIGQ